VGEIRLGKIHLRWCDHCNVPILEQSSCGKCGGKTRAVTITPPGDARPAFESDIKRTRSLIDEQFGQGTGKLVLPERHIALLNKAPDLDRMDEVIVDGEVVGAVRFSMLTGERFLLRSGSANAVASKIKKAWVKIDPGAAKAIREKSASTLAIGVLECDPAIVPGTEVLVLDPGGKPVSVGTSKMSAKDMMDHKRGTAVKTRWVVEEPPREHPYVEADWSYVVEANQEVISRRILEAKEFIKKMVLESELPVAVSYSGGKDSLATLLLVLDAGVTPKLLFVDTGLEFAETVQNVQDIARDFSLELVVESAGESFWKNIEHFGPPAKDFRWCCKTCKLGPATRLIEKNFPGGVLSFIGQRAYESEQRARKGAVWRNPWTPNQLAASPIQKWTALHVWLYLMSKGARVNPLYEKGLERIGCFMCPATDLAELRRVREISPQYERWQKILDSHSRRNELPSEWLEYDIWRWKRIPKSILDELRVSEEDFVMRSGESQVDARLVFKSTSGYNPCVDGLSMEGVFSRPLDMSRVGNMLNMIGEVVTSPEGNIAEVDKITVFAEGPVMVKARDEKDLKRKASHLKDTVFRAMDCAGCGICVARCKNGALRLEGQVRIDVSLCTHCGACFGPCPVVTFKEEELDI
jgi:phosphoadenosine phosphosulfate reductase